MNNHNIIIRHACYHDCAELLTLMKKLAEFEGYIEQFKVTQADLEKHGFGKSPTYNAIIAKVQGRIIGMAAYYFIEFTYDLKPWLFIKELYVDKDFRNKSIGQKLMSAVAKVALSRQCSCMKWDVLTDNNKAKRFYEQLGSKMQSQWTGYKLDAAAISKLAITLT